MITVRTQVLHAALVVVSVAGFDEGVWRQRAGLNVFEEGSCRVCNRVRVADRIVFAVIVSQVLVGRALIERQDVRSQFAGDGIIMKVNLPVWSCPGAQYRI